MARVLVAMARVLVAMARVLVAVAHLLGELRVFGEAEDVALVLVRHHARREERLAPLDVVGLDHGGEDGEAGLGVHVDVIVDDVGASDDDLLTGARHVDQVPL